MRVARIALVLVLLAGAALLFLALRPGGGDGDDDTSAEPARFEVAVGPEGPGELEQLRVRQGQPVELEVTMPYESDVHLHGYDIMSSTGPGRAAREARVRRGHAWSLRPRGARPLGDDRPARRRALA